MSELEKELHELVRSNVRLECALLSAKVALEMGAERSPPGSLLRDFLHDAAKRAKIGGE